MTNNARAWLTGTPENPVINLDLPSGPRGAKGDKGDKGDTGATPNIAVGNVVSVANPGDDAWLSQLLRSGSASQQAIRDTMPSTFKGDKGDPGGWNGGTLLANTVDLDTVLTPGLYYNASTNAVADTKNHYPPMVDVNGSVRGILEVISWTGNSGGLIQRYTRVGTGWVTGNAQRPRVTYQRTYQSGTGMGWTEWSTVTPSQTVTDSNGFKSIQSWEDTSNAWVTTAGPGGVLGAILPVSFDLNNLKTPGKYYQPNSTVSSAALNYPPIVVVQGNSRGYLTVSTWNGQTNTAIQEYTTVGTGTGSTEAQRPGVVYRRTFYNEKWTPWYSTVTQRIDNTAGRAIYTFDDTMNREQLIYGDTGWRMITSLLLPDWTASSLRIRRTMHEVTLQFDGLTSTTLTGHANFLGAISGFTADQPNGGGNQRVGIAGHLDGGGMKHISPEPSTGNTRILHYVASTGLHGQAKWFTKDPWPTELPGTAIGASSSIPTG